MRHARKGKDVSAEDIAQLQGELEQLLGERWRSRPSARRDTEEYPDGSA